MHNTYFDLAFGNNTSFPSHLAPSTISVKGHPSSGKLPQTDVEPLLELGGVSGTADRLL